MPPSFQFFFHSNTKYKVFRFDNLNLIVWTVLNEGQPPRTCFTNQSINIGNFLPRSTYLSIIFSYWIFCRLGKCSSPIYLMLTMWLFWFQVKWIWVQICKQSLWVQITLLLPVNVVTDFTENTRTVKRYFKRCFNFHTLLGFRSQSFFITISFFVCQIL